MRDPKDLNELVTTYGRARVRAALTRPGILTDRQRFVIDALLRGKDTTTVRGVDGVSRQAIFKVRVCAVKLLRKYFTTRDRNDIYSDRSHSREGSATGRRAGPGSPRR